MSENKLRIGVVGAGNWAKKAHLSVFANQENVEVIGITDLDESRAKNLSAEFNIPKHYSNLDNMLAKSDLDILDVITSRGMYFQPVMTGMNIN